MMRRIKKTMKKIGKKNKRCVCLAGMVALTLLLGGCTDSNRQTTDENRSAQENVLEQENNLAQENMVGQGNDSAKGNKTARENRSSQENTSDKKAGTQTENKGESSEGITFEGRDIEGNMVSSDIFSSSKLTMVNVWATYCNPCLREMPGLGELAHEYEEGEFQIIGIISDVQENSGEEMIDFAADLIERTGADYPHLLLNESLYYALLTDVSAVPTTFFIDENGEILDTVVGSMDKSEWEKMIRKFLGE